MFDTYFLADTVTIGTRERIGNVALFPVLQAIHRLGMRNVTDAIDRRMGMAVFANPSANQVFIIENHPTGR